MRYTKYLSERWLNFVFVFLAFAFSLAVYTLDKNLNITQSNARYILIGWILLFTVYLALDYIILSHREKKFKNYCRLNTSSQDCDDFFYPLDKEYAELIRNVALEYENYKGEVYTKAAEEKAFITKWIHDVKVPMAAAKLILENHQYDMPGSIHRDIYKELFSIEESIQRVFYEIKSNRFYDDYKITKVSTKKLIAQALKPYSSFFSHKKINITFQGDSYEVLTDEKWSSYILSEIISNAVKYSPVQGAITIGTEKNGNETIISIKNTGKGISSRDMGQVFKKGYTSSDHRNGMKATGYGLYLAKKLSDLLGHGLSVQSEYNQYAIFNLVFFDVETIHKVTKM